MASLEGEESKQKALAEQRVRQQGWMKRKQTGSNATWRPRKRYRKSAYQVVCHLHNQLVQHIPQGLLRFQVPMQEERGPPISWNRLSLSPDQGSEGVSGLSFGIHRLGLNVDVSVGLQSCSA